MKTVYNKKNKKALTLFFMILCSGFSFVSAQEIKSRELAFNFSFFNLFESAEKSEKTKDDSEKVKKEEPQKKQENKVSENSCESFDYITEKLLSLETSSASAKEKIENVEETINKEESVRDSIFYSVKNLFSLQKKDKVIFREMRKDLNEAKNYYDDLDDKINETGNILSDTNCEEISSEKIININNETEDLVQDEATFRKQFVASLKEKMKILQDGVKEAKK